MFSGTINGGRSNTHKKLNLHSLRKGYGSNMAKLCPPHTLRELMGHSSIVTTMEYYVQDVDENKKKAVEGLDRMMEEAV
ncbi:MAG TPA: tyrosine-type recombinase/integrase [Anaerohalosphaeraceae bacterium]|nr:tyrosine-type recombinase/integrase [Anaerohalosphaeraceae bacterium]